MTPLPRSLSRLARSKRREVDSSGPIARGQNWLRTNWRLATGHWAVIWPAILAFAGVWFAPGHVAIRGLRLAIPASSFLSALWQIEAVALALSAAVVIFGFQAFSASRHSQSPGSLQSFVQDSGLFIVLGFGIGGLLLPGFVLLGYGQGAPGGWAATWTSSFCGLGLVLIPVLFVLTIISIDPNRLDQRRNRHLRQVVERAIREEVLQRIAVNRAIELLESHGMTYLPIAVPGVPKGFRLVKAPRSGIVADISLHMLDTLADPSRRQDGDPPRAYLCTRIGALVTEGTAVAILPTTVTPRPSQENRIATYTSTEPHDTLSSSIAQLHEETMEAVKEQRVGAYQRAYDAYVETLLAVPKSWDRYKLRFTKELAGGITPFELGTLQIINSNLFEEARTAMLSGNREIATVATNLLVDIAKKAVPLGALELSKQMLDLAIDLFKTSLSVEKNDSVCAVQEFYRDAVFTFTEYVVIPELIKGESSALSGEEVHALIEMATAQTSELIKVVVDAEALETVRALDDRWSTVLQLWHPDNVSSSQFALDTMESQLGEDDTQVESARHQLQNQQLEICLREESETLRATYRMGLAMWALRGLRQSDGNRDQRASIFHVFARHFNQTETLVIAIGNALNMSSQDGPWRSWLLFDDPGQMTFASSASFAGPDSHLIRCFLVLLIRITDPNAGTPVLPAQKCLKHEGLQQALEELAADSELWTGLAIDSVDVRIAQVRASLDEVIKRINVEAEEKLAIAATDPEKTAEFLQSVSDGWEASRVASNLFRSVDSLTHESSELPTEARHMVLNHQVRKDLFTEDSEIGTDLSYAFELGVQASAREMNDLVAKLAEVDEFHSEHPSLADAIGEAIAEMQTEGYLPTVVIAPVDWPLWTEAGFDVAAAINASKESAVPFGLPEHARRWLRGTVAGLPLLAWSSAPKDLVTILDIASFGCWHQWTTDNEGHELSVELNFHNPESATSLAESNPNCMADADHIGVAERVIKVLGQGRLTAHGAWSIEIKDLGAARRIRRPNLTGKPEVENYR